MPGKNSPELNARVETGASFLSEDALARELRASILVVGGTRCRKGARKKRSRLRSFMPSRYVFRCSFAPNSDLSAGQSRTDTSAVSDGLRDSGDGSIPSSARKYELTLACLRLYMMTTRSRFKPL